MPRIPQNIVSRRLSTRYRSFRVHYPPLERMEFIPHSIFKGPGLAETLFIGTRGGRTVIRKQSNPDARPFSRIALVREIRLLRDLPPALRPFYPPVIATNLRDEPENSSDLPAIIWYELPYYAPEEGWEPLSRCLLDSLVDPDDALRVLGEIMDTAFAAFRLDARDPSPDYPERTMLAAIRESIGFASAVPELAAILSGSACHGGRPVGETIEVLDRSPRLLRLITPVRDRFIHGDFFPENILINLRTGEWLLIDPVSVRGVHRGDFTLDTVKMGEWLSGELPALRRGLFTLSSDADGVRLDVHTDAPELANLRRFDLYRWYHDRLCAQDYADVFDRETGWETRTLFVRAFYAFSMLPLADNRQATARAVIAREALDAFLAHAGIS